jgi:hypothetical protein
MWTRRRKERFSGEVIDRSRLLGSRRCGDDLCLHFDDRKFAESVVITSGDRFVGVG